MMLAIKFLLFCIVLMVVADKLPTGCWRAIFNLLKLEVDD